MGWPWRYRYEAVIIGLESGNITALPFVRFRRQASAYIWSARMNDAHPSTTTRFAYRLIDRELVDA